MDETEKQKIKKFLSEIQMLKRVRHEGFRLSGVKEPDSIAEHTAISAQIAYILGELEGADGAKCAAINLFHDNHEARIGDITKIGARYIDSKEAKALADAELFSNLPAKLKEKTLQLRQEGESRSTLEGIVAKDADWLETALQAKIYSEQGYKGCFDMIDNVEKALKTDSAKELIALIREDDDFTNSWWQGLKKLR